MAGNSITIRGAGGGGKGGGGGGSSGGAHEISDTLRSIQYVSWLDLVSEGRTGGLVAGAQSIFLNGTPLQNPDGTYNFNDVTVGWTNGEQVQDYLPGFSDVENEVAVNAEVKFGIPVTRQITNPNVNKVRVTVSIPRLTSQSTTSGDIGGYNTEVDIYLQANGGGFVLAQAYPVSGKTTTKFQKAFEVQLTGNGDPPYDIKLVRPVVDAAASNLQNATWWDSYTEIIDSKLTYPNSMLVGGRVDASQFSSVPSRAYESIGVEFLIPSNYDPLTRVYTGIWDGTFSSAATENPAWVFYGLLTNTRFGLGDYIVTDNVDKWALYSIGQYCDELVPDGFGGFEPRFTCNLYLQTASDAYKLLTNIASIFRGMSYWGAGAVTATSDQPKDPVAIFTPANVIGKFGYSGSAKDTRHTVALVTWNDPANEYKQAVEYVEDADGIDRYGVKPTPILAFGCTSRGQAHRLGKWLLYTERMETELVKFQTGINAVFVQPGDIIRTHDPLRAGVRFGGRLLPGATTTELPIDGTITIEADKTYTASVMLPDGSLETRDLQSAMTPGDWTRLYLTNGLSDEPQSMAMWVVTASDLVPESWRVVSMTEVDKTNFEIVALEYHEEKFAAVEEDIILEPRPTSRLKVIPDGVTELTALESLYVASASQVGTRVTLSWSGTTGRYRVRYWGTRWNLVVFADMPSQTLEFLNLPPDVYTFVVQQVNALGAVSLANTLVQEMFGKTLPPSDITGFSVRAIAGVGHAMWNLPPDDDVRVGGSIVVRWTPLLTGFSWNDGFVLDEFHGNAVSGIVPLMTGTYMVKAFDGSSFSRNPAYFAATESLLFGFTTVGTVTESPTFAGTKTRLVVDSGKLQLDAGDLVDSLDDVDGATMWDSDDGTYAVIAEGEYLFASVLDCTTVASRRWTAAMQTIAFDAGDLLDSDLELWDDAGPVDGDVIDDCDATLFISTTNDNPAGSPTWGPWTEFLVSDFTCRAARFKLELDSGNISHNIACSSLSVSARTSP